MTVERKLYLGICLLSILIFAGLLFIPGKSDEKFGLPWQIEHPSPGTTRIFGLTLGVSSTSDAEQQFHEEAKASLFKSPSGTLVAEMFFEQVTLAGLKSRIVVTIAVPEAELQAMYERGLRISGTGSGKKITLASEDAAKVRSMPIASLTYIPSVSLEEDIFSKRFGTPSQRIREKKSGTIHWLYPHSGLDIALGGKERPVLQYVPPKDFDNLVMPLISNGEIIN